MNKKEFEDYKRRAEQEKAKDGYNASQILKICETEIQAGIAYQLTRIADMFDADPNITDGIAQTMPDTPACDCEPLRTAVEGFFKDQKLTNTEICVMAAYPSGRWKIGKKNLVDLYEALEKALAAHTCKPQDIIIPNEFLAKVFFRETGIVAPWKIQQIIEGTHQYSFEERKTAWQKWLKENNIPKPAPDASVGRCDECNNELVMVGHQAIGAEGIAENYDCPVCLEKERASELADAVEKELPNIISARDQSPNGDLRGDLTRLHARLENAFMVSQSQSALDKFKEGQ